MKELTKEELIDKRKELEAIANETQEELSKKTYAVEFEKMSNIKAVLKQIDKSYSWNIKNAALVIRLYDTLNNNKIAIQKTEDSDFKIEFNSLDLNTLYKVLTSIEGTGIEAAKTFTRLLTNVGKQISEAMDLMAKNNKKIQDMHVELAELDAKIESLTKEESAEEVKADEITE